jgi:hypothetical protein
MNASYLPQALKPTGLPVPSRRNARPEHSLELQFSKMAVDRKPSSLRLMFGSFRSSSRERLQVKKLERGVARRSNSMRSKCSSRPNLPSLTRLIKQRQFDEISRILEDETDNALLAWLDDCRTSTGSSPLHVVLPRHPPVDLVSSLCLVMARVQPGIVPEEVVDTNGATPLTVAIKVGSDFDVIIRLLSGQESLLPAMTADSQQRLPLHWACVPVGRKLLNGGNDKAKKAISTSTIRLLISTYPQARAIKDALGYTPLDLAKKHLKKNYHHQILDDLVPESPYQEFKGPSSTCMSTGVATAMSTVTDDIPREIFCVADISYHKRRIEGLDAACGLDASDHVVEQFEQVEL